MKEEHKRYLMENGIHRVEPWRIVGFSGVNLAVNLYMGLTMYMSYYLNGFVGMAVVFASSFSTVMRLWDGITDPMVGFVVDKFGNRIGKTRACMTIGGVLLFVNSFLMFRVTHLLPETGPIRGIFFTVFALLFYIGYTFLNVSMHTGNVCLTNDPKQRPFLSVIGTILVRMSRALVQIYVASLVVKYGKMSSIGVFEDMWLLTAVAASICIAIAFVSIAPKDIPEFTMISKEKQSIKIKDYVRVLKKNRPLQMLIVSAATDKLAATCRTSAISVVVFGIIIGNYQLNGGWTLYTTIFGLIMMTLGVGAIGGKMGLKKSMQLGSWGVIIFNMITMFLFVLSDPKTLNLPGYVNGYGEAFTGFTFFTVGLFLLSILGEGSQMICTSAIPPMVADINDYEASQSGKYMPGMVATIYTFVDKLISAAAPMLVGVAFAWIGFKDKLPDVNTPYSVSLFWFGLFFYYGTSVLGALCNVIAMKYYELTPEKMSDVRVKLDKMRKEGK
ncbi:MAG: MFS transporter [Lachnospirales bacterium]